jgi:hypothetical protein
MNYTTRRRKAVKTYIIDRFEEELAVLECEDETFINLPRAVLPKHAKEGNVIREYRKGRYRVNREETEIRRKRIEELMGKLFHD